MHTVLILLLGFSMLVVQSALSSLIDMHAYAPNALLPLAIYLGISSEVHIVRGASICFVLGYLLDAFCGSPMGLQTFVLVASFMVARGAGLRLVPQGMSFQILLTFVMALGSGGLLLALRAIFERRAAFMTPDSEFERGLYSVLRYATATAITAPPVFWAIRRLGAWLQPRSEEKPAT